MNKKDQLTNLETLLAAVHAQPEAEFHLSYFRSDDNNEDGEACGSLFCTVGLACTMPVFQAMGFRLESYVRPFSEKLGYYAYVGSRSVVESDASDEAFGFDAYKELFSIAGDGKNDGKLGYNYCASPPTHTHKELAIARLRLRIAKYYAEITA